MSERMKIAVMGSGGVGGLVGGRLATVGADVHFVARRGHLDGQFPLADFTSSNHVSIQ